MSAPSLIVCVLLISALTFTICEVDVTTTVTTPESSVIDRSSHYHYESPTFQGFWKKKFIWRPRWVKTWQEKKLYIAVWKRMWSPAVLKEWVPVPKPPPGWVKGNPVTGAYFVKVGLPH